MTNQFQGHKWETWEKGDVFSCLKTLKVGNDAYDYLCYHYEIKDH